MGKTLELKPYVEILQEINNIQDIEKVEIIEPPEDAEADISLKVKLKPNTNKWKIQEKIQKIRWKYSKEDNLLTLYIEFEN